MRLYKDLGFYIPAFFLMQVDTDKSIENVNNTGEERIFSHELIHFLQDVSTTYGLINISQYVDAIKSQNKTLINAKHAICLPLTASQLSDSVMANTDLFSIYAGDGASEFEELHTTHKIIDIIEEQNEIESVSHQIKSFKLKYASEVIDAPLEFYFGSMTIYESMADLIENELYPSEERKRNFPYDTAIMLAEFLHPEISKNKLAISEICEASLMFYNPAEIFIETLRTLKSKNIKFQDGNKYYEFVLSNYTLEGTPIKDQFIKDSIQAENQLDDLFTVTPFKEEKWASSIVAKAREMRKNGISISSQLWCQNQDEAIKKLFDLVNHIGIPIIFNKNFSAWVGPSAENLYTPLMYPAILSFYEIIKGLRHDCFLQKHCENENSSCNPDDNCQTAPWIRSNYQVNCYFSQIWKMWGLAHVQIKI